jgi:uncharacterized protein (TIGR02145 family)
MKMITKKLMSQFILVGVVLIFINSCKKDDNSNDGNITPVFNSHLTYGTMTDQDGNVYRTIQIGLQTWMAENLRTTKYNDGTAILNIKEDTLWRDAENGAYCSYYNTTNADTIAAYGLIYNWTAVHYGNLAPNGWHVPSENDWALLSGYPAENYGDNAGSLMETGKVHWRSTNTCATNETGFTALPGGNRSHEGTFHGIVYYGDYWSTTVDDMSIGGIIWGISCGGFDILGQDKHYGAYVRCVKDNPY